MIIIRKLDYSATMKHEEKRETFKIVTILNLKKAMSCAF